MNPEPNIWTFFGGKKHTYLVRYVIKTHLGQPLTLAQPPAQQWKIHWKFKYFFLAECGFEVTDRAVSAQLPYPLITVQLSSMHLPLISMYINNNSKRDDTLVPSHRVRSSPSLCYNSHGLFSFLPTLTPLWLIYPYCTLTIYMARYLPVTLPWSYSNIPEF